MAGVSGGGNRENRQELGRPRVSVNREQIVALRASGASWATVCGDLGFVKGDGTMGRG